MTVTDDFRAARDRLLAPRSDYAQARREFEWRLAPGFGMEYSEADFPGLKG